MLDKIKQHKWTAGAVGLIGAAAVTYGAVYGVPPSISGPLLRTICTAAGLAGCG
jgi:hypothetical protein